jgi:ABC-type amino acid transport substrate-binding protein
MSQKGRQGMNPVKALVMSAITAFVAHAGAAPAWAADDLLATVKSRGVMRVCNVDYAPWNVRNPASNQWEGVNVDLMDLAAGMLKVKVEHVDATWATVIPSVITQKCDFAAAGLYVSAARAELVTFTRPIATDGISIFVAASSPAKTVEDLDQAGKTIVVRSGGFEEGVARSLFKHATVKTLTADQAGIITLEIASGRADAGAGGYFGNLSFLKSNPNVKVKVFSDELLAKTSIAYAVPPREYFFRDWLNAVLLNLEENGKIKEVLAKWTQ